MINRLGSERGNGETPPRARWDVGDIVEFTSEGDPPTDGLHLEARDGTWQRIDHDE